MLSLHCSNSINTMVFEHAQVDGQGGHSGVPVGMCQGMVPWESIVGHGLKHVCCITHRTPRDTLLFIAFSPWLGYRQFRLVFLCFQCCVTFTLFAEKYQDLTCTCLKLTECRMLALFQQSAAVLTAQEAARSTSEWQSLGTSR